MSETNSIKDLIVEEDVNVNVGDSLLVGPDGPVGPEGPQGPKGKSAYEVALENGFTGTEEEWLASLKAAIDDSKTDTDTTWSSSKIDANIRKNLEGNLVDYAGTFEELQSDSSIDTTKIYKINNTSDTTYNNHFAYYNGTYWIDGGVYQNVEIKDKSVGIKNFNNELNELLNLKCEKKENLIITNGQGFQGGTLNKSRDGFSITEVIQLNPKEILTFYANSDFVQMDVLTLTDITGEVGLQTIFSGSGTELKKHSYRNETTDIQYLRITYKNTIGLEKIYVKKGLNVERKHIEDGAIDLAKLDSDLATKMGFKYEKQNLKVTSDGRYITASGTWGTNANYSVTEVITLQTNEYLKFKANARFVQAGLLALTDVTGEKIESIIFTGDGTTIAKEWIYQNTTANIQYLKISYYTSYGLNDVFIYAYPMTETETKKIIKSQIQKFLDNETENPLESIIKDSGFTAIFDKIACIGDSLTKGSFDHTVGTDDPVPNLDLPSQMQKIIGNTVYNLGIAGFTASRENPSTSWYDSAIRQNWFETYKAQAYIIALGFNDMYRNNNGFDGDIANDIDVNNYINNSNNSVGGYATIIQKILEVQPDAKIFCVTIPNYLGNNINRPTTNTKIKEIAELFNCYIIDLEKYYVKLQDVNGWKAKYYISGHLNALGYKEYANIAISYIDWIIRNNINDFRFVQFIGTDLKFNENT